ncbi:flagellar biosynthesis protein FlgG [Helicobacter pylori]|nr:flagellar biosynthesis protein FlgG [Helicobacter pylori]OOP91173.1 flagellar biosynthesis protein FlgG [Helicobacter pylori]OOQ19677.1 flagellar biosynthesis protein FlgG [Helicobacter pylori]
MSLGANVALTRGLSILTGPIGWVITGALVSINLAGPAYRVTVPACVLVATLRKKLKAEQEANKTKKMWYLAITFLIGLAVLAVFFIKGKHHSSNDPSNNPKSGVENLKNPSHNN